MTRVAQLGALMALLTVAGTLAQPVQLVKLATSDGTSLVCRQVGRGDTVTLVFTHSMYGGEVRERWRVDSNTLARERIVTDNAAAAEYYATNGQVRRVAGGYEVIAPPLRAETLYFRIDQIGGHRLRLDGEEIPLAEQVDGSVGAALSARQVPLVARLFDGDAGCGR